MGHSDRESLCRQARIPSKPLGQRRRWKTTVSFSESDRLVAFRCTRKAYFSVAVWDILEISGGPDCGRRFAKLARVDNQISKVQTQIPQPDSCAESVLVRWASGRSSTIASALCGWTIRH